MNKLPNELPNTDEPERIAAALIVDWSDRPRWPTEPKQERVGFRLKPVWFVDFFRGRPS